LLKVKVEDPNALRFILQDDVYLLGEDKLNYNSIPIIQPEIKTTQISFNYLGANKKSFLILVNYPDHDFMTEDHLTALESVLGRIGCSRDDVAILNIAKNARGYAAIADHFKPQKLLILGQASLPTGAGTFKLNQVEKHGEQVVLYTFGFSEMMTNTINKKAFWEQVKTL
jgi:hypothetical protein